MQTSNITYQLCQYSSTSIRPTRVAVVREEYVALTKDIESAIILNQCVYWMERVHDFDAFIQEEMARNSNVALSFQHGYFWKSYEAFNQECMLGKSNSTISRYITKLIERNWLDRRKKQTTNLDQIFEYRVNLSVLQQNLMDIGYVLNGYTLLNNQSKTNQYQHQSKVEDNSDPITDSSTDNYTINKQMAEKNIFNNKISIFQNESPIFQNEKCNIEAENNIINKPLSPTSLSKIDEEKNERKNENEIKKEVKNNVLLDLNKSDYSDLSESDNSKFQASEEINISNSDYNSSQIIQTVQTISTMLKSFSDTVLSGRELASYPERDQLLLKVLNHYLEGDMQKWQTVCHNITKSKFLMGESRGSNFKATLDWVIKKDNAVRILEGDFNIGDRSPGSNIALHNNGYGTSNCNNSGYSNTRYGNGINSVSSFISTSTSTNTNYNVNNLNSLIKLSNISNSSLTKEELISVIEKSSNNKLTKIVKFWSLEQSKATYQSWFSDITCIQSQSSNDHYRLYASSRFKRDYVETNFSQALKDHLIDLTHNPNVQLLIEYQEASCKNSGDVKSDQDNNDQNFNHENYNFNQSQHTHNKTHFDISDKDKNRFKSDFKSNASSNLISNPKNYQNTVGIIVRKLTSLNKILPSSAHGSTISTLTTITGRVA